MVQVGRSHGAVPDNRLEDCLGVVVEGGNYVLHVVALLVPPLLDRLLETWLLVDALWLRRLHLLPGDRAHGRLLESRCLLGIVCLSPVGRARLRRPCLRLRRLLRVCAPTRLRLPLRALIALILIGAHRLSIPVTHCVLSVRERLGARCRPLHGPTCEHIGSFVALGLLAVGTDSHDRSRAEVVFYSDGAMREFQILLHDGQSRPHSPDIALHRLGCRAKAGELGPVFPGDARSLVCESHRVARIKDGHGCFFESRMDEVFRHFSYHRIGDGPARFPCLLVDVRREFLYELACGGRLDDGDAGCAQQIVV